jgi:hypothetical protein
VNKGQDVDEVALAAGDVTEPSRRENGPVGRPEGGDGHGEGHQPGKHAKDSGSECLGRKNLIDRILSCKTFYGRNLLVFVIS